MYEIQFPSFFVCFLYRYLVLDGQTLSNLEILTNQEGEKKGSLLNHIDHCSTSFGRRNLQEWLCRPLCRIPDINARLDAVEALMDDQDLLDGMRNCLRSLPDLERMISRIHAHSMSKDVNAIMYGNVTKAKIDTFLKALDGFRQAQEVLALFQSHEALEQSAELKRLVSLTSQQGIFPDYSEELKEFEESFDHSLARRNGFILPNPGVHPEYDACADREKVHNFSF